MGHWNCEFCQKTIFLKCEFLDKLRIFAPVGISNFEGQYVNLTILSHSSCKVINPFLQIPNNFTAAVKLPNDFDQLGGESPEDPASYDRYLGTGAALLASLMSSLYVVSSRYVSQRKFVEPIVIAFYSGIIGLVIAVILGPTVFDRYVTK